MDDKDLIITRIFNAPIEKVWEAWTIPEKMKCWWGPATFTAPVIKIDFRVGGKNLSCMRSQDGKDYWSTGEYKEIIPMQRIVCTDSFSDAEGNIIPASDYGMEGDFPLELLVTFTFEKIGEDKTKFTLRHECIPAGDMQEQTAQGWNESFDKLDNCLSMK